MSDSSYKAEMLSCIHFPTAGQSIPCMVKTNFYEALAYFCWFRRVYLVTCCWCVFCTILAGSHSGLLVCLLVVCVCVGNPKFHGKISSYFHVPSQQGKRMSPVLSLGVTGQRRHPQGGVKTYPL